MFFFFPALTQAQPYLRVDAQYITDADFVGCLISESFVYTQLQCYHSIHFYLFLKLVLTICNSVNLNHFSKTIFFGLSDVNWKHKLNLLCILGKEKALQNYIMGFHYEQFLLNNDLNHGILVKKKVRREVKLCSFKSKCRHFNFKIPPKPRFLLYISYITYNIYTWYMIYIMYTFIFSNRDGCVGIEEELRKYVCVCMNSLLTDKFKCIIL